MSERPSDRGQGPDASVEELDVLFGIVRSAVRRGDTVVDVDRAITTASSSVERRRRRRLALLRVTGMSVIVGVLLVWIVGFSDGGGDILYTVVMFAAPAIIVLRWHLESLDGGGLRPWRTPPTVEAWSRQVTHRVVRLTEAIVRIDQLSLALEVSDAHLDPRASDDLIVARRDLDRLRARLSECRAGAGAFIASCRVSPGEANWVLLRQIDPDIVAALLRQCLERLRGSAVSPGFALTRDAQEALERAQLLLRTIGRQCADLVDGFDTLHRIATQETLQRATTLNVVRRATSSAAVVASGLGRSAVQRSAIRAVLLAEAPAGGPSWWPAVRHARAIGSAQVLALSGALS